MALPATDNFNRANESPLAGNWTTAPGFGNLTLLNQEVIVDVGAWDGAYWNADSFSNDQYSLCNVTATYGWRGPGVRIKSSGTGNCYFIMQDDPLPDGVRYFKVVDGSFSQLGSTIARTNAANEIWKLSVSGTTLTANIAGSDLATRTDSSHSAGSAGMFIYTSYKSLDDWEGGNLGAAGGVIPAILAGLMSDTMTGGEDTMTGGISE